MNESAMYAATEIRDSTIFGKGLFATEPIPVGKILCFFPIGAEVITEERFLTAVENNEQPMLRTATRYAGRYYTHGNLDEPYTFLNHSFAPNLLCHCGMVLARRSIDLGEELTIDYRTLVDETDIGLYHDARTGQEIRGWSARQTLLNTAKELIELLESTKHWNG